MDNYETHVGVTGLRARISAVLDANGEPTTLPAIPSWGSTDLSVAVPDQAPDGMSCAIDVEAAGECDIYVDTAVSPGPGQLVQGRCHLTVKPAPGEVRTVIIELSTE